jgi:uncharacterized caspase-like protein
MLRGARGRRSTCGVALSVALTLIAMGSAMAQSEKRVALVIGNANYNAVAKLSNPTSDSQAVAGLLKRSGFDVVEVRNDLSNRELRRTVNNFSESIRGADVAVVYFAGHGIEVDGTNYLIPVDAELKRDIDVEDEALSLDRVLKILEPVRKLRVVILDACRDNPFAPTMKRSIGTRSVGRGLARVEPAPNTLIAFAAKAGSTADDGEETTALSLQHWSATLASQGWTCASLSVACAMM